MAEVKLTITVPTDNVDELVKAVEYISTAKNTAGGGAGLLGKSILWNRRGTQTGIFTICAVRTTGTDAAVFSSLNWEEIR